MSTDLLRDALDKAERVFAAKPEAAQKQNPSATARWVDGARFEITGPSGERATSDMPAALGGTDSAPVPGWYLRAAMAACSATSIRMHAARLGIALTRLEVTVHSRSDARGLLGLGGVSAGLSDLRMDVRIGAADASEAQLRELVQRGEQCSPIGCTLRESPPCELVVEIVAPD